MSEQMHELPISRVDELVAAERELATLKSTSDENQRERFARYAEEHAKVLGLEAEVARLNEKVQYWTDAAADCAQERHALRVRLGTAEELLRDYFLLTDSLHCDACARLQVTSRAFLSDGAP